MRALIRLSIPTAASLILVACAGGSGPPPRPGPGPDRAGLPQIFISPFGQLFVAPPGQPYPVGAWFASADTDADGTVSRDEFAADGLAYFEQLDSDDDGRVSNREIMDHEAEVIAPLAAVLPRPDGPPRRRPPGGPGGPDGPGGPGGPGGGGGGGTPPGGMSPPPPDMPRRGPMPRLPQGVSMFGLLNVPQPVRSMDLDLNQRLEPGEVAEAAGRWFALLDTDGDGRLTPEELPLTGIQAFQARR